MKKMKLLPLYTAVFAGLYGVTFLAHSACLTTTQTTVPSSNCIDVGNGDGLVLSNGYYNKRIDINNNITASGNGLVINPPANIRYSLFIGRDNNVAHIKSINGTGIQFNGQMTQNDNILIQNGSSVEGAVAAIRVVPQNTRRTQIYVDGAVLGNIIVEGNRDDNQVFFGRKYQSGIQENGKNALFRGDKIVGISKITNAGNLIVASKNAGTNWGQSEFISLSSSQLNFLLENANITSPIITAEKIRVDTTDVNVILSNNLTVDDIKNKNIILLSGTESLTGNGSDLGSITLLKEDGSPAIQASQPITQPDEWISTQQSDMTVASWKENNQFLFRVEQADGTIVVIDESINSFMEQANLNDDQAVAFVNSLLNSYFVSGSSVENFLLQYPKNKDVPDLAKQLLPNVSGGDIAAANTWIEQMRTHVGNRTLAYRHQLPEYEREDGWNFWASSSFGHGNNNNHYGYRLNRYGVHIGMDRQINDEALLGFSFGANRNNVSAKYNTATVNSTQVTFMPYLEWKGDLFFAGANMNVGLLDANSQRTIGNTSADGRYKTLQLGYQLTAGLDKMTEVVNFRPYVSVKHQWLNSEGWKEAGSPFALEYHSQKYSARHMGIGASLWKAYDTHLGKFVPSLDVSAFKQFGSETKARQTIGDTTLVGNTVFGNQYQTKVNLSLDVTDSLNISGALGFNKFGDYKESTFGLTLSNSF